MRNRKGFTPLEIPQSVPVRNKSLTTRVNPVRNFKFLTGFTLIELLVVITIITVLAGLLLPGVMRAMKQAKSNRALSEMQHLATVITQVYSEVGYYVTLESLVESANTNAFVWLASDTISTTGGRDDEYVKTQAVTNQLSLLPTKDMWNGPYTTYKSYYSNTLQPYTYTGSDLPIPPNVFDSTSTINNQLKNAPLDPWGRPYRMFWITGPALLIPAGANGAMVIISAGGDGILQSLIGIGREQRPTRAQQTDFTAFDPSNVAVTEKDVYYIFNAGIQ